MAKGGGQCCVVYGHYFVVVDMHLFYMSVYALSLVTVCFLMAGVVR